MEKETTPVLLLTGYLGSGKTTLLNRILSNRRGIKFAVIVNDIGEVNIDADLIEKGGIVGSQDDSLVALQNGCICCTLKMDLVEQLRDIIKMQKFDYIVIEASGICEPAPIAQTICSIPQLGEEYVENGSFWKIDNLTLGYTFNTSKWKIVRNLRVYASCLNLLTITSYKGLDPEMSFRGDETGGYALAFGTDHRDKFPTIRSYTFGINVTF